MFYQESLNIALYKTQPDIVKKIDFFLGNLTREKLDKITVSYVYDKIGTSYELIKYILEFYTKKKILKKQYEIHCPECGNPLERLEINEIYEKLPTKCECYCCNKVVELTLEDVFISYQRVKSPTSSKEEIKRTISEEICELNNDSENNFFSDADSLVDNPSELYQIFYNPNESAYKEMKEMKDALDFDYKTSKEKGDAYERLVLKIIGEIRCASVTEKVRTYTNQIDCTVQYNNKVCNYPSILDLFSPYFLVECKNEKRTPSNTYFHKLSDIMSTNEAQVGIIFSREKPSEESLDIAYQQYLINRDKSKGRYLISISDDDLEMIIDKKVNFLEYIHFKYTTLTMHIKNAEFSDFKYREN